MYVHKRKHLSSLLEKLSGVKTYAICSAPKHSVPIPKISIFCDTLLAAPTNGASERGGRGDVALCATMSGLASDTATHAAPAVCIHWVLISRQLLNRLAPFVSCNFSVEEKKKKKKDCSEVWYLSFSKGRYLLNAGTPKAQMRLRSLGTKLQSQCMRRPLPLGSYLLTFNLHTGRLSCIKNARVWMESWE